MLQQTDEQSCSDAALVTQPPCHSQSSTADPDCPTIPSLTVDNADMSSDHPTLTHTSNVIHLTRPDRQSQHFAEL